MIASDDTDPRPAPWPLRHVTKLLVGAGLLLLLDSRTTNVLLDAPDPAFDVTLTVDDSPVGWRRYLEQGGKPEKARVELERLHVRARAHLSDAGATRPDGLDPLLAIARRRVDERAYLEAEPLVVDRDSLAALQAKVAAIPGATLVSIDDAIRDRVSNCASGLSSAFATATGSSVLTIDAPDAFDADVTPDAPRITMTWSARAGDRLYGGPGDHYLFPGIVLTATLHWQVAGETIASLDAEGDPGPSFEFTTFAPAFPFGGEPDAIGISGAMIEAGCMNLGQRWIEELTGLTPPVDRPGDATPLADKCRSGDAQACRVAADDLRVRDPDAALALLESGCRSMGLFATESCLAAAELALEQGGEMGHARATIALETGCEADDGVACTRAADLSLSSDASAMTRQGAYHLRLRGCDLGAAQACLDAAEQTLSTDSDRTPSPMRAKILATRACAAGLGAACERAATITGPRESAVHDVPLERGDTIFDVRWGMWFEHEPAEVVWIASTAPKTELEQRLVTPIALGRARVFDPSTAPPGVRGPTDAVSIFGLIDAPALRIGEPRGCPPCSTERATGYFALVSACTCLP